MTISTAITAAQSGLTAASRGASVVSENIANAQTEGYGVRSLSLSSVITAGGQGVRVTGVSRDVDPVILGERRAADAAAGEAETRAGYLARLEAMIGPPGESGSLSGCVAAFEAGLVAALARPDSQTRLQDVLTDATALATKLNDLSEGMQGMRREADATIATEIERLNRALASIHDLNGDIRTAVSRGENALGLIDRQQALIDSVAELLPIREQRNAAGMVSLSTLDGLSLLDGRPAQFGFTPTPAITPLMSLADGDLSGLTVNGRAIATNGSYASISGGTLAALFAMRDEIAVTAQARLDGLALDLAARFDDPGLDPTLGGADPGLFTDDGVQASAGFELGLAGRLRINQAVDPGQGGALWRLRDGLGATSEGSPGDTALLQGFLESLQADRATSSAAFSATQRSLAELAAETLSLSSFDRQTAEGAAVEADARLMFLKDAELSRGVDTDRQLQQLMQIERAYAANARVLSVVDEMLDRLMGI